MTRTGAPRLRRLFPTFVIETHLDDAEELNPLLAETVKARRKVSPGVMRSNYNGWHSDTEMLKWGGEPAQQIAIATLETCSRFTDDVGMRNAQPRYEFAVEMWANVSPPGASNQNHAHAGALWSAVYYVDDGGDGENGALMLLDPRFPTNRMYAPDLVFTDEAGVREETTFKIAPTPGKLVLFPAWLMHGVKPHRGPRDRISIAVNVLALPARPRR
jgi:uncharacterized protein (TIGR02466 family)